ncbi:MAG: penicillin acylase family protein [Candidatus Hodarchaeales archaeon]
MIGIALRLLLKQISKRKLPKIDGTLKISGLHKEVEVIRDTSGVPHIFASDNHDLFFAQGFIQAQDRFWQMELNRRTANGTLSEIFGELALETDIASRTFGFARLGLWYL